MYENEMGTDVVDSALRLHQALGSPPDLRDSVRELAAAQRTGQNFKIPLTEALRHGDA